MQDTRDTVTARVVRESLVALEDMPLFVRLPSLPALDRGARVSIEIEKIELLDADIRARYVELLPMDVTDAALEAAEEGEGEE